MKRGQKNRRGMGVTSKIVISFGLFITHVYRSMSIFYESSDLQKLELFFI